MILCWIMNHKVFIGARSYLVLIQLFVFLFFCVIFDMFGNLLCLITFLLKTCISKTTSLRHVFDKVPSAKWPHKPGVHVRYLSKPAMYIFYHQNFDFKAPTTFSSSLSNAFIHLTEGACFLHVQCVPNMSNTSNISDPFNSKDWVT